MPKSDSFLSSEDEISIVNDNLSQSNEVSKKDKKVIQNAINLTKKILDDEEIMQLSAIFLNYLQSDEKIDNQLMSFLDKLVIKAEEFCLTNQIDCDADFFNNLMFSCLHKHVGKSNNDIIELREKMLFAQFTNDDYFEKNKDASLQDFYDKSAKKIFIMCYGIVSNAGKLPSITKNDIAREETAMILGLYRSVFSGMANILLIEDDNSIKDEEYEDIEKFLETFINNFINLILSDIQETLKNIPYIKQVYNLADNIQTAMWKLSCYLNKWQITNKKHSKQDEVDELLEKIKKVIFNNSQVAGNVAFDPYDKYQHVIKLIETCILKISKSITKNGSINTENKAKLLSLTTDILNDLYRAKSMVVDDGRSNLEDYNNLNFIDYNARKNGENHFFQGVINVKTAFKPEDVIRNKLECPIIDEIRKERKKVNSILNNFFVKIVNKLTFGLVALTISAFKKNPLLEKLSNQNDDNFEKLPESIKKAGGVNNYITKLKPKLLKYEKQMGDEIKWEFRSLAEKKPRSLSDMGSEKKSNFHSLAERNLTSDKKSFDGLNANSFVVNNSQQNRHNRQKETHDSVNNEIKNSCPYYIPTPGLAS